MDYLERFELARDFAHNLIREVKENPSYYVPKDSGSSSSLINKLTEIYADNSALIHDEFTRSNLLKKLMQKEQLNCLVVDLYPHNVGYTITVKTRSGHEAETKHLLYCEDEDFLNCVDNGEIPPFLLQWFPYCRDDLFHNGCIVAEVREHRNTSSFVLYDSKYVLLKPTTQSDICEVSLLTKDQPYTLQELDEFESNFTLCTAEPLCLDPSPAVTIIANYLQLSRNPLARESILKHAKKHNPARKNRKRKFNVSESNMYNYFSNKLDIPELGSAFPASAAVGLQESDALPGNSNFYFSLDDYGFIQEHVIASPKSENLKEDSDILDEEYKMEIERNRGVIQCTKVAIMRVPADEVYYGILSLNCEGEDNWTSSQFFLGSRAVVDKYIKQFKKIFTEDGCKNVKITHLVPGCDPEVYFTPAARERRENSQSFFSCAHSSSSTSPSAMKHHSNFSVESIISSSSIASRSTELHSSLHAEKLKKIPPGSPQYRSSPAPEDSYIGDYGSCNSQEASLPTNTPNTSSGHSSNAALIVSLAGLWSFQAINAQSSTNLNENTGLQTNFSSLKNTETESSSHITFMAVMKQIKKT